MRTLLLLLPLIPACRADLRCGLGTHREGDWCVADQPAADPDDTVDDLPAPEDTEPPEDTTETEEPDEPEPVEPELPTDPPPFFGDILFIDAPGMEAFCELHDGVYGNMDVRGLSYTDLLALECLTGVIGNLNIDAGSLTSVHLPNLRRVRGGLTITSQHALTISLPSLTQVDGNLIISNAGTLDSLVSIQLPALEEVGLDLRIDDTVTLSAIELPSLTTVGRNLWFRRHGMLDRVEAPLLASLGGALRVEDNALIHTIDLPQLSGVGDVLTGELAIEDNAALQHLDGLSTIRSVSGSLVIRGNPMLPQELAEGLRDSIGEVNVGGVVVLENNAAE